MILIWVLIWLYYVKVSISGVILVQILLHGDQNNSEYGHFYTALLSFSKETSLLLIFYQPLTNFCNNYKI